MTTNAESVDNPKIDKTEKPAKPPVEEAPEPLSHAKQAEQIDAALSEASAAGLPSAAAFKAMWKLACTFHASGMFKDCQNPSGCFVKMLLGDELGLKPIQAMMNIDIIDGSPAMSGQLMLAKFQEDGGTYDIKQRDETGCVVDMTYKGLTIESSFLLEDVNRAKLGGKDNHVKYPRAMMWWRAISDGIKVVAPGCLLKAYTFGELTSDQRNLSGYLTMSEGVEENTAPESPPQPVRRKTTTSSKKQTNGSNSVGADSVASQQMIKKLRELLESPACPVPFAEQCKRFIDKHKDKWPASSVAKWMNSANQFCWQVFKNDLTTATEKQLELLHKLLQSSAVPEFERTSIHTRIASGFFGKRECSAWIESLEWYIRNKERLASNGDLKPKTETGLATLPDDGTSDAPEPVTPDADGSSNRDDKSDQPGIDQNTKKAMLLAEIKTEMEKRSSAKRGDLTKLMKFLKTDFKSMTILDLDAWSITVRSWPLHVHAADATKGDS